MTTIAEALAAAFQHHQAGELDQAEQLYGHILRVQPDHVDALHLLGLVCHQTNRHEQAVAYLHQALRLKPDFAEAHYNLGNALREYGKLEEAIASYQMAVRLKPGYAEAHYNLGNTLREQGKRDEAIASYQQATRLKPDYAKAWINLGHALQKRGQLDEAVAALRRALHLQPGSAKAHTSLGNVLRDQGKLDEAVTHYQQALRFKPDDTEVYNNLGTTLKDQGKLDAAVACYHQALRLKPDSAEVHNNLGVALQDLGKFEEAVASYQQALRLNPDSARMHNNLGAALREQGKLDEAVACYHQALRLQPDFVEAHTNLGNVLQQQGKLAEAVACYQQALGLKPDHADVHMNLGNVLQLQGRLEEALASYQQALCLKPDNAEAHWNRALTWLLAGSFEQGWPEYEWRWQQKGVARPCYQQPLWDGSPLEGRTILLHVEQGLGDTLQFIRYAPLVQERGGRVLLVCPATLVPLLSSCRGLEQLIPQGSPLPPFDVQAPLLSLPGLFRTTVHTVPAQVPYLFADPQLAARWRDRLATVQGLKVGIAWQGNPRHSRDRLRSMLLTEFEPLARVEGVRLISLQRGPGMEQLAALGGRFAVLDLGELDEATGTFMETAAVLSNLDLVITCDTATAHLAGALGVPVWVALPFAPDWRWLRERADSPWYPTMRLFRQERWGDWAGVFQRLAEALQQGAATSPPRPRGEPPPAPARRVEEARCPPPAPAGVPDPAGGFLNQGVTLGQQGKLDDAVVAFQEALLRRPGFVEAWFNLGIVRAQQGKPDEAVACYQQALRLDPGYAAAHINLGVVRMQQGQLEEAVASLQEALRLQPERVEAHLNLGKAFTEQGQREQALTHLQQAVRLQPDVPETHYHVAALYNQQGDLEPAVASWRQAIRLRPDYLAAYLDLGNAFMDHGQLDEAVATLRQALPIQPENAAVHKNLALVLLLRGDWELGWQEYEWRGQELAWPAFPQPLWDGAPLAGRTILLHTEQGLGDTLQFIRYAALVKERGGRVIVACPAALHRLLACCRGIDRLVTQGAALPAFDVHLPLLSLPRLFRTTPATVPAQVPYLFADPELREHWRRELSQFSGFKIGIAWQGNPQHREDRWRSMPLTEFEPLARVAGVCLLSLQKGAVNEQLAALGDRFPVLDLGRQLDETSGAFMDTAAVMTNLDLVITCDTAAAHLAGALGVPAWVALPLIPDWRWLLHRADSPWYPTVRLFRQRQRGNWSAVFQGMAQELHQQLEQPRPARSIPVAVAAAERLDPSTSPQREQCPGLSPGDHGHGAGDAGSE